MFIKTVTIVDFKSIEKLCFHAEQYNLIASDRPGLNRSHIVDAIRFVLDENHHDSPESVNISFEHPDRPLGHVRLVVTFADGFALPGFPTVDDQHAEIIVTRYLSRPEPITVAITGDETVYSMSVTLFHRLLYGSGYRWNTSNDGHLPSAFATESCMQPAADGSTTDGDGDLHEMRNEYQRNIIAVRNCHALMQRFAAQLVAAEEMALERRTLRFLRNSDKVPEWRARLQQCHQVLHDRTEQDVAYGMQQVSHANAVLQCQRNIHIKWGTHKLAALLAHMDEIRGPLEALQRENSVRPYRAAQNDDERLAALQEFGMDLRSELEVLVCEHDALQTKLASLNLELFANSFACQPNVDSLRALVDRSETFRQRMMSDISRMTSVQLKFGDSIAAAEQKLATDRDTVHTQRLRCDGLRSDISSATNKCIHRIESIHRLHLEWMQHGTTNLYHPTMRTVFQMDKLIAVDAVNAVLDNNPELASDFVGYVIDFVVFKPEYNELGAKLQFALKDLLLNVVFTTERLMIKCMKLPSIGHLQMWAIDSYRSNAQPIGLAPTTPHIRPLSAFLQPLPEHQPTIVELLDDFVVMDTDAYELAEVARMFKRNVICARTGRWTMYGSPYDAWPMVTDGAQAVSVFDVWQRKPARATHYDDLKRQSDRRYAMQLNLEQAVNDLRSSQLLLDKALTDERSTLVHLSHLHANAFRTDRTVQQARPMLHRSQAELHTYAELLSGVPVQRSRADINRICIEKQRTEIAVMQSSAKTAALCDRIRLYFLSITATANVDGSATNAVVDDGWLDEPIRTIGQCREAIEADWQRLEETSFGGRPVEDEMAENRDEMAVLTRFDVINGLQKALTKQLQQVDRDERLLDDRSLLEHFVGWTAQERLKRRHELQRTVDTDAALRTTRRRYQRFKNRIDNDLTMAEGVLRLHQSLYKRMFAQRLHQIGRFGDVMRTLLPLIDGGARLVVPQLMLVWDALNGRDQAEEFGKRSLEIVLKNGADGGRLLHVGRHEKRWLTLMEYLVGCVVRKERSVLVLDDLLKNFSDAEMVQIVDIMNRTELLNGLQCFHVADDQAMRRYVTPGL